MIKIFLVVLNWNGYKDTVECLKSVEKLKIKGYRLQVVVVDNGSTDKSVGVLNKYISKLPTTNYQLLVNKANLGYTGGMNVGLKYAIKNGADYMVALNNDTILHENLITGLLKTAKKFPKAGVICPKTYFAKGFEYHKKRYKKNERGNVIWYAGGEIDWNNVYGSNKGVDEVDKGQYEKTEETDFASGNCMFFNAKALKDVGLFDNSYYMYLEDVDLCMRMKRKEWKVLYSPEGRLWHKVAQSSGIGSDLNDYFLTRNRMKFGMKYAPIRTKLALIKESWRFLTNGRFWQKIAIKDFYLGVDGRGSWK